jgi:antitoxin component of RelBE/YafQ-DinJ toxin-antitoxin module
MLFNMVLKTFNLDKEVYERFSQLCKENGISMSNQINTFINAQIAVEPKVREEYLNKLERIRKGNFIKVSDFKKKYLN